MRLQIILATAIAMAMPWLTAAAAPEIPGNFAAETAVSATPPSIHNTPKSPASAISAQEDDDGETLSFASSTADIYKTGLAIAGSLPALTVSDAGAGKVTYSSDRPDIVSVTDGVLSASDTVRGTAVVTARLGSMEAVCTLRAHSAAWVEVADPSLLGQAEECAIIGEYGGKYSPLDLSSVKTVSSKEGTFTANVSLKYADTPRYMYGDAPRVWLEPAGGDRYYIYKSAGKYKSGCLNSAYAGGAHLKYSTGSKDLNPYTFTAGGSALAISSPTSSRHLWLTDKKWGTYTTSYIESLGSTPYVCRVYRRALRVESFSGGALTLSGEWDSGVYAAIDAAYPSASSVDLTAVSGQIDGLPTSNPNRLFIVSDGAASDNVRGQANVVTASGASYTASSVRLTDGKHPFRSPVSFTAASVSYGREYEGGKTSTVCLPFTAPVPEGASVYALTSCETSGGTMTARFCLPDGGVMEAYTPYVIKADGPVFASVGPAEIPATPASGALTVSSGPLSLVGVMSPDTLLSTASVSVYGYSGGTFGLIGTAPADACLISPFRAYMTCPRASSAPSVSASLLDVGTGVEHIQSDSPSGPTSAPYRADGAACGPVPSQTGVYVGKGLKVAVKGAGASAKGATLNKTSKAATTMTTKAAPAITTKSAPTISTQSATTTTTQSAMRSEGASR